VGAIDTISLKFRLAVLTVSVAALLAVMLPASAEAFVYWTNYKSSAIGRADLDGTGVNQDFTNGSSTGAVSLAVDGGHVYWANLVTSAIGRANIDGSNPQPSFIGGAGDPEAVAVDGGHIYWAGFESKSIGRANLNGSNPEPSFISVAHGPEGVAVDGAHVYWTDYEGDAIGRANLDGTGVEQKFIAPVEPPETLAVDSGHLYWVNEAKGTIARADLGGGGVEQSFIDPSSFPSGLAVDSGHVYWSLPFTGVISRADLDGSGIEEGFVTGANFPTGVAVDSLHRELPTTSVGATSLSVTCAAAELVLPGSTSCTAVVVDSAGSAGAPTGTVAFSSNGAGVFGPTTSCSLVSSAVGAACQLTYTPGATGNQAIIGAYGGDLTHRSSSGGTALVVKPSNVFALARPKLDRRRGTATLTVTLPGSGSLVLGGSGVRRQTRRVRQAGKVNLPISPRRKTARKLKSTGSAKVRVKVTYTPTGGDPSTRLVQVLLKLTLVGREPVI
jgi:hypothetical protein